MTTGETRKKAMRREEAMDKDDRSILHLNDQGAERLAIAIVKQAADEYERVLRMMLRKPSDSEMKKLKALKSENERFFLSSWCEVLLQLTDGQTLMKQIQKNAVKKEKERAEKKLKKAKEGLSDRIRKGD